MVRPALAVLSTPSKPSQANSCFRVKEKLLKTSLALRVSVRNNYHSRSTRACPTFSLHTILANVPWGGFPSTSSTMMDLSTRTLSCLNQHLNVRPATPPPRGQGCSRATVGAVVGILSYFYESDQLCDHF
jgi:hypothetical protein